MFAALSKSVVAHPGRIIALSPVVGDWFAALEEAVRVHRRNFLRDTHPRAQTVIANVAPLLTAPADPGALSVPGPGGRS
jgi:hypothetical protein